ncbi:cation-translocating P-type ATPase [Candidatus Dependentiae bacterium]|nr:cation-translocating P-type ATPase [Candidatus Dependentiae bacterium]
MENNLVFTVTGMSCVSCVGRVEKKLKSIPGIKYVSINIATEKGFITAEPDITLDIIKQAVLETGYGFSENINSEDATLINFTDSKKYLILSLIPAIPLIFLMILHYTGFHIPYMTVWEIIFGLFSIFVAGKKIIKSAIIALSHFHTNMDVLIFFSALSAILTSFLSFSDK